jgi:hypothetical protein
VPHTPLTRADLSCQGNFPMDRVQGGVGRTEWHLDRGRGARNPAAFNDRSVPDN